MISLYPFSKKPQQNSIQQGKNTKHLYQFQQIKSAQIINPKLIVAKKHMLPEIQSPFLKKTVSKLFSSHEISEFGEGRSISKKEKQMVRGLGIQNREKWIGKMDEFTELRVRIGKSFSETKKASMHFEDMTPQKLLAYKKSEKIITKASTQASTATSSTKEIYEKIKNLKQSSKFLTVPANFTEGSYALKQYKAPNFALKYKLAASHESPQAKAIKNKAHSTKQQLLRQNIQIKNYVKFTEMD